MIFPPTSNDPTGRAFQVHGGKPVAIGGDVSSHDDSSDMPGGLHAQGDSRCQRHQSALDEAFTRAGGGQASFDGQFGQFTTNLHAHRAIPPGGDGVEAASFREPSYTLNPRAPSPVVSIGASTLSTPMSPKWTTPMPLGPCEVTERGSGR